MAASEFVGAAAERPGQILCAFKPQGRRPFRGRSGRSVMKALTVATGWGFLGAGPKSRSGALSAPIAPLGGAVLGWGSCSARVRHRSAPRRRAAGERQSACREGPPVRAACLGRLSGRLLNRWSFPKRRSLRKRASLRCCQLFRSRRPGRGVRRGGRTTASGFPARPERRTCSAPG